MVSKQRLVGWASLLFLVMSLPGTIEAKPFCINARSAILIDMSSGKVLFEQDADLLIPPASITKVLTLYLVFDAIRDGQVHLWDTVRVSTQAAKTPPSRMGLRAGREVQLEELIKGAAVVSGNDACVAIAEHMSGSVDEFVRRMNIKARELGMVNSYFKTPNGLPAKGQLTTARDISRLSTAYLRRYPESLSIHSMRTYTYNNATHRNPNRLLGKCPGVDGLKTGFVCASGYNLSATAKRGNVRLLAVVLGAPSPGIRAAETAKLLEMGFDRVAPELPEMREVENRRTTDEIEVASRSNRSEARASVGSGGKSRLVKKISFASIPGPLFKTSGAGKRLDTQTPKVEKSAKETKTRDGVRFSRKAKLTEKETNGKAGTAKPAVSVKQLKKNPTATLAKKTETPKPVESVKSSGSRRSTHVSKQTAVAKDAKTGETTVDAKRKAKAKEAGILGNKTNLRKQAAKSSSKKTCTIQKSHPQPQDPKDKKGKG